MEHWGHKIRRLREERGISQIALARACNVKQPSVNDWESGKTKMIDGWNLISVASALGVPPESIFDRVLADPRIAEQRAFYYLPVVLRLSNAAQSALAAGKVSIDYVAGIADTLEAMVRLRTQ